MTARSTLPDLSQTYTDLRRFDCQRCGHAFQSRQPRVGCPACKAPIDMVARSEIIDYSNEGERHEHSLD
jgi:rubrerythrin